MLFEAVIGCGSLDICRLWLTPYWLVSPLTAVRGEWLKRGLHCRKLVCPPRFHAGSNRERLVSVGIQFSRDQVVIAVDPHKGSWTAAAVDSSLQPLASIRVPVSREGYRALRRFARRWPNAGWAIEGATGVGAPLTRRLRADDIEVIDVPAKLATRVRLLSVGHGRKNDDADALSVGIAALTFPTLNTADTDAYTTALRAIVDHRDDLVKTRTQTVNRLHVVLTHLVPRRRRAQLDRRSRH